MRQQILSLLLLATALPSFAAPTLYVDSQTTATTRNGSTTAPFKTLQEAIPSVVSTGGTLNLKGGIYKGPFKIANALQPIKIQTLSGESTTATLQCSVRQTGWTAHTGPGVPAGVYKKTGIGPVAQVFFNNKFLPMARYPQTGFLSIAADAATDDLLSLPVSPTEKSFLQTKDTANMLLTVRAIDYWFNNSLVSGLDATNSKLNLSSTSQEECDPRCAMVYPAKQGWGYFLQNKLWMMTQPGQQPGQWAYEKSQNTLYVWLPGNANPNTVVVESDSYQDCLTIENSHNVTLANIHIKQTGGTALALVNADNTVVSGVTIQEVGRKAIHGRKAKGLTVSWSRIERTGAEAVYAENGSLLAPGTSSGNRVINNNFVSIGMATGPHFLRAAVFILGPYAHGTLVQNNLISDTAYVAIFGSRAGKIIGNTVRNYCLWLDDCSAIYTGGYGPSELIEGNFIAGATANREGKPNTRHAYAVAGIYLDDYSDGVTVRANHINGAQTGIMLHNARNNILENNYVTNATVAELRAEEDHPIQVLGPSGWQVQLDAQGNPMPSMVNNIIRGNYFIDQMGKRTFIFSSNQGGTSSKIASAFSFSGNKYNTLFTQKNFFETSSNILSNPLSFEAFRQQFDVAATVITGQPELTIPDFIVPYSYGENAARLTSAPGVFTTWSSNNTQTLVPSTLCGAASPTVCWRFTSASQKALLISSLFAQQVDEKLRVRVRAYNLRTTPVVVRVFGRRSGPTYESVIHPEISTITIQPNQWAVIERFVRAADTLSNARFDFEVPAGSDLLIGEFNVTRISQETAPAVVALNSPASPFLKFGSDLTTPPTLIDEPDCSFIPAANVPSLSGRCLRFTSSPSASSSNILISKTFPANQGQMFRVRVHVYNNGSADHSLVLVARLNSPDWRSIDDLRVNNSFKLVKSSWNYIEWYFRSGETLSNARLDIAVPSGQNLIFKNIQVHPVTAAMRNNLGLSRADTNDTTANKGLGCTGLCTGWSDSTGASVSFPSNTLPRSTRFLWNKEQINLLLPGF